MIYMIHCPALGLNLDLSGEKSKDCVAIRFSKDEAIECANTMPDKRKSMGLDTGCVYVTEAGRKVIYKSEGGEMNINYCNPGDTLIYNDGREGHTNRKAVVLEVGQNFIIVQFEDRASSTTIMNHDKAWTDFLSLVLTFPKFNEYITNYESIHGIGSVKFTAKNSSWTIGEEIWIHDHETGLVRRHK
jgi:hypothetical protein